MNTKTVIRQLNLTKEGFEKIQQSVKKAESKTSGEIAICVTAESSDYSMWEFLAAFFASGIFILTFQYSFFGSYHNSRRI